ncbi:MAG: hypothetical protein WA672_13725 [Candidatus Angelobacter sp.]
MSDMGTVEGHQRVPEARYTYYRRCQVFRRNGAQCKAPAEKGAHICHAHASQLAIAVRRERERRAMLAEAVAEMRKQGRTECEMADLFMDFKGIQVTLAVMARAVINGRIDCKTAGQMLVQLQTFSKLLWQIHRKERKGRKDLPLIGTDNTDLKKLPKAKGLTTKDTKKHEGFPQICTDERRWKTKNLPLIHADDADLKNLPKPGALPRNNIADSVGAKVLPFERMAFGDRCRGHGPPKSKAA